MHPKKEPTAALLALARSQAGVLTRRQLVAAGAPRGARSRWIEGWVSLGLGYYCTEEPSWLSWCWAGLLRAGATGVVTGLAAGHLHGFVPDPPSGITIYHRRVEGMTPMGDGSVAVRFRRGDRAARGTPRRTPVEDALLDTAKESDENQTIAATTRALAQRLTTPSRILRRLRRTKRVRHRKLLEALCLESSVGVESVLEWRFLELVIRNHGLPEPDRQLVLVEGSRSDATWEEFGVVAELDGRLGHDEPFRDMARDNRLAVLGMLTLRYGWHDVVDRPCEVAAEVHAVFAAKGWRGSPGHCSACRGRVGA